MHVQYDVLSILSCRIKEDLQMSEDCKEKLLTDNEECSQALINLLLTGQAVKYLHNGNMIYNNIGKLLVGRKHFYCTVYYVFTSLLLSTKAIG